MNTTLLYFEASQLLTSYDSDVRYKIRRANKIIGKEATFKQIHIKNSPKNFRCDFYCPNLSLIVEINGGEWSNGSHVRGKRYNDDLRKANIAQLNDFIYLQYTYTQLSDGVLIDDMKSFKEMRKCQMEARVIQQHERFQKILDMNIKDMIGDGF